jgi:hypothetical protein
VAIVIGAAWWQIHESREQAKEKSPVSFLLDLRDALTPPTIARRLRKVLVGTAG